TLKEDVLYVAVPIEKNERLLGVLRTSLLLNNINDLLNNLKRNIFGVVVFIVLISFVGAFIFSKSLTKPIRELSAASRKVAGGDFDAKVFLRNKDEVKELADSFNTMADQIKTLFEKLSRQKESLNSIISSLKEGFLVLDKKDRIILSNESFKKLIKDISIKERFYWEVIRETKFGNLIKMVRDQRKNVTEEMKLKERIYLGSATFMEEQEEIVVILHDITAMKKLDKIKKDFVVNVSHELRTPLTAIKGFAETLEDLIDDEERQYVEIIKRNTDRLINIVRDLLLLSELEESGAELVIEEVNVREVIDNVLRIFQEGLKGKGLDLNVDIDDMVPSIKADPFKLEQMFINLIDNAVKYTEEGKITVTAKKKEQQVEIVIEDTGIGIPEEELNRIFERFYVVDKSRSRKSGGTGLGLSIVKHILFLHNGTIGVENIPASGTKFTITLPINQF
ncbi:MAG: HAMP domain-containing protein, partial [Proteobacteria bacterium]|nr:HAMP domain-containing protein [Pseudomonadota bacterium]